MGVLAHEVGPVIEGFLLPAVLAHIVDHLHAGVHLAAHVIGDFLAMDGALVMDRQWRMGFQILIHGIGVGIASSLVAKTPHDDGSVSVDLVPLIEPGDPIHIVSFPLGIMADGVVGRGDLVGPGSVGLQIVFVHDVETVFICQL